MPKIFWNHPSAPTMASQRAAPRLRTVVPIALASLLVEIAAWWRIGTLTSGVSAALAVSLGMLGMVLAVVVIWQLWRINRMGLLELQRAKAAAARAVEHERATEQAQREAEQASVLLVTALDALPIGIAIFDQHDRQVIRNQYLDELFPGLYTTDSAHETLGTMLHRELEMGVPAEAMGHKNQWIAQQLAERGSQAQPILQRQANDRWIHNYEVHTAQGFTVVARAEVTDLVRKEQLLAQANEQLSLQSATDGLTGIANRRRFDETLDIEWQRAARNGNSLSLLMVDIDHFKLFNDHYGHLAGDECLRRVSHVLASCVRRAGEILARYGGEEFVMLMPGADQTQAVAMAQRCLNRIAQEAIPHGSSPSAQHVTFSIGIACVMPSGSREAASLVNAADTAMYRAKMAGRARYEVADIADWEIDKDAHRTRPAELT
jgi:diguanylate cyclase (GGDEF)-like protein